MKKRYSVLTDNVFEELKENLLFQSFIQEEEHWTSLMELREKPECDSFAKVNALFHKYYVEIRFIAYVTKLIRYTAINFDRKRRLENLRYPLTLDQPVGVKGNAWVDFVEGNKPCVNYGFEEQFASKSLYSAYKRLTSKQKEVLDLSYRIEATDTEIAEASGISQQAVSRRRKRALEKLREARKESGQ
ncbi:sigma-70 family RNA polymerase sigma factor [Pseudalkalibacillus hwajinpoensis]|uniref:sigma-70 family RNA polymerase sigma factor n=1 Tax=Guptibacillus hwajinpoensis TaxID=208199 RepID=UPI00325B7C49